MSIHPNIRITILMALMLIVAMPLSAQGWFGRERPRKPVPQSSKNPMPAYTEEVEIPTIMKPMDGVESKGEPKTWLGMSLPQLIQQFPGLKMVADNGERVIYKTTDDVFFEFFNNRVVVVRGDIKGNWKFPDEKWFIQTMDKVEVSGFKKAVGEKGLWKYFYSDFYYFIRYNRNTDVYSVRYEYLLLHNRYGELQPEGE